MAVMDSSVSLIVTTANQIDLRAWQLREDRHHEEEEARCPTGVRWAFYPPTLKELELTAGASLLR